MSTQEKADMGEQQDGPTSLPAILFGDDNHVSSINGVGMKSITKAKLADMLYGVTVQARRLHEACESLRGDNARITRELREKSDEVVRADQNAVQRKHERDALQGQLDDAEEELANARSARKETAAKLDELIEKHKARVSALRRMLIACFIGYGMVGSAIAYYFLAQ